MALDPQTFRTALGHFAAGVTVVTARAETQLIGLTVTAFASLSLDPPLVLVCIAHTARSHAAFTRVGAFAVNILTDAQQAVAQRFGRPDADKFLPGSYRLSLHGLPLLEDVLATLECRMVQAMPGGDHTIFIGEVLSAQTSAGQPLLYYRSHYGHFAESMTYRNGERTHEAAVLEEGELAHAGLRPTLIARFERLKPFLLFGTGMLSLGVVLLTTLTAGSSLLLVSAFLLVMALGIGTLMPVTTLAVQSAAEPRVLGVATSATQFIRSIGPTVGTAAIGALMTSGYIAGLRAAVPRGVPESAITALHSPNALVNQEALQRLTQLMAAAPNRGQLTQTLLEAARAALTNAVHTGFFVILGASLLAFASSFLIEDLRLGSRRAAHSADDQAQIATPTTIEPGVGHEQHGQLGS